MRCGQACRFGQSFGLILSLASPCLRGMEHVAVQSHMTLITGTQFRCWSVMCACVFLVRFGVLVVVRLEAGRSLIVTV